MSSRRLALFDLDHTLLPIDSDHSWGEFLVQLGWVDGETYRKRNDEFYARYQAGTLDIHDYIAFSTRAVRERDAEAAQAAHRRFMCEVIEPAIKPVALELVRTHQANGDLCVIVTATNEFVTRPIARAFGVEHLIAVELERDAQGTITGRIRGVPSFREGKVARVEQFLREQGRGAGREWEGFERISFYSDSTNDLPLLERATDPVATNPSPALEAIASDRGWRILKLFND